MKKFVFSMEKILELRRFEQRAAETELSKVIARINKIQSDLEDVAVKKAGAVKQSDAHSDFSFKVSAQNYISFLDTKKENLLMELAKEEMLADEKRAVVRDAMQKVKVLEKLREKKFSTWKREYEKEEENTSDDINSSKAAH